MDVYGYVTSKDANYLTVTSFLHPFKPGDKVKIKKAGVRSIQQNRLYWAYLRWLVGNGLKEHGFFVPEAVHAALKGYLIAEKILKEGEFRKIEEASTVGMNSREFTEYIEMCDLFITDFFKIDTSPFWDEVALTEGVSHGRN